jgi:hypothetical protein
MAAKEKRKHDGSRHRCMRCGHPKVEHRMTDGCTVPKCVCGVYQSSVNIEVETPAQVESPS